jgi:hypothetical protein
MMKRRYLILVSLGLLSIGFLLIASVVSASPFQEISSLQSTPTAEIATRAELEGAYAEWSQSKHAETYDQGLGANTTCAKCKSPANWDPQNEAVEAAHDCGSCKRIPGAPRPDLKGGVIVPQHNWKNISCDICHQPVGDSFDKSISFWNQAKGEYESVASVSELCGKCHVGRHGFEVIEEQETSPAHQGWECTRCHGSHGSPSKCSDCHNPNTGKGAEEHLSHTQVNCTACHDAGALPIWQEIDQQSLHYGEFIPVRFAHALTSWPSHNLQLEVRCQRCHHPFHDRHPVAAVTDCEACHEDGGVLFWCRNFPRDSATEGQEEEYP